LKLRDLKGALLDAEFAVRDGENNAKAYFRQGQVGGVVASSGKYLGNLCLRSY